MNDESVCRVLVVDNELDYAAETAAKLKEIRPALLNHNKLEIELTNNAYFVAEELRQCSADRPRWDVIISDLHMTLPSLRGSNTADSTAVFTEYHHTGTWPCWEFKYPSGKLDETIEHGGSCITEIVTERRAGNEYMSDLKMILMSDRLSGEERDRILSYQKGRGSWLRYYDKADWGRDRLTDWPAHQSEPDMFQWALCLAIAERRTKDWGPLVTYENVPDVQAVIGDKVSTDLQRVIDESWRVGQATKIEVVLITGEVGTGREVFARFVHHLRMKKLGAKADFVGIDCSSISHEEFQQELFDHAEEAAGGTLFIDEVDKLTPPHQGKIYHLLKDKTIRGAERLQTVDFTARLTICTASESNLEELNRSEMFHADLYFLLKDEQIHITPLRKRPVDAVSIAEGLAREGATGVTLTDDARKWIEAYEWRGNNKELRSVITAATGRELSSVLTANDLEAVVKTGRSKRIPRPETDQRSSTGPRTRNFTAEPPFQLHWGDNLLIDRQKRPIPLADDLYRVLKELLRTEKGEHGFIKGRLSFDEVAALYKDIYDENHAERTARRFVQNLRRFLKKYGVNSSDLIQTSKGYGYQMGLHWAKPPVIYTSEASLVLTNDIEKTERDQLQKDTGRRRRTPEY